MRRNTLGAALLSLATCAGAALAQIPPLANEFQVNTFTTRDQTYSSVAMDRQGSFVVVWHSPNQDGDKYGIIGRRFDHDGTPRSGEFIVNSYSTGYQFFPTIASDPSGRYVVAWSSVQDGSGFGIYAQRFGANGGRVGGEFRANTHTADTQRFPNVASDPGGNFVVVWDSYYQDGSQGGIFGQRFDNAGVPVGAEFQVNTYTMYFQNYPHVAMNASGGFVVVWSGLGGGFLKGIFARRFDSSGAPIGDQFRVSSDSYFALGGPSEAVAMDRAGDFVVVWNGYTKGGSAVTAGADIIGRRYDGNGVALGGEFLINSFTTGTQGTPGVAMDGSGNFIATWKSPHDGSGFGSFGRRYDRFGTPVSEEFRINAYTTGDQGVPRVTTNDTGAFVVSWDSYGQDGYGIGVFARPAALAAAESFRVDAHAASSGSSNLNGVLEPGETVVVEPAWKNNASWDGSVAGSSPDFDGPAGATYTLEDNAANYGGVAALASFNCFDATGDCYEVAVSNPASRPATHWDALLQENLSVGVPKTWTLHVGTSFTDVPATQPFYRKIEALLHTGITAGCTPTKYCPSDSVSRSQMAIFLAKGIAGSGAAVPSSGKVGANAYNCKAGGTSLFTDVLPTDIFCKQVHHIASQNVTLGCSTGQYCPGDTVTRLQMAGFVAKAVVAPQGGAGIPLTYGPDPVTGLSYSCDAGAPNTHFADVPATDPFCKHVYFLWAKGIISGCSGGNYCPGDPVTRDAMAKFLGNAFNLQLYGP